MALHSKVYIGHVETINQDALESEKLIESKVVLLQLIGLDEISKQPKYKPLKKYSEYYKIVEVEAMNGLVSNSKMEKALKKTGKKEVKLLKKVA